MIEDSEIKLIIPSSENIVQDRIELEIRGWRLVCVRTKRNTPRIISRSREVRVKNPGDFFIPDEIFNAVMVRAYNIFKKTAKFRTKNLFLAKSNSESRSIKNDPKKKSEKEKYKNGILFEEKIWKEMKKS
jgi:hypothetical protein